MKYNNSSIDEKSSDGSSLRLGSSSARARLFLGCPGSTFFGRAKARLAPAQGQKRRVAGKGPGHKNLS